MNEPHSNQTPNRSTLTGHSRKHTSHQITADDTKLMAVRAAKYPANAIFRAVFGRVDEFGVEWQTNPALTLRAGYGKTDNPILGRDVTFNILAPGVVRDHYTLGFTYALDKSSEISGSYLHAKRNSVTGASFFNAFAPGAGGNETIEMYQNALGIAWARHW